MAEATNIPADEIGDRLTVIELEQACDQIDRLNAEAEKAGRR